MAEQLVSAHPQLRHVFVDGDPGPFMSWSALPAGEPPAIVGDTASRRCFWCRVAPPARRS